MGGQRVVFFILPIKSHLSSRLNLASILHSKGFSISIISTRFNSPNPTNYPEFTLHTISDGLTETEISTIDTHALVPVLNRRCVDPFKECLSNIISNAKAVDESVTCLIADAAWYFVKDVADSLELRRLFVASCASFIGITLDYALITQQYLSVEDKDVVVPEFAPLRIKDFPTVNQEKKDSMMLKNGSNLFKEMMTSSDGIIFNTFEELESPAISRLENQLSSLVFPCGPFHIIKPPSVTNSNTPTHNCISWLDRQQPKSVIYVSIGTLVSIEKSAFLELAWGIAATNRPFLWVVRSGSVRNSDQFVLPNEFMESVEGRGIIVDWAPQPKVLAHPSVGGFWNHGGWNSVLESICEEVPMICLPFIGDQMINARYASEVWKIGLYFEDRVEREAVKKAIERLMEGKESEEMRVNIACLSNKAKACVQVGGSSYKSMDNLIRYIGGSSFDA